MSQQPNPYFGRRQEMVAFIPPTAQAVVDVGAANGDFGQTLKKARPDLQLFAVEPVPGMIPAGVYHEIFEGRFEDASFSIDHFDVVVFNDVLEHMIDPWSALRLTHSFMTPDTGVVVASVPSIRNLRTMWNLTIHGDWTYEETGVLDHGHLRFFTPSTMAAMFTSTGYTIQRHEPINLPDRGKRGTIRRLACGRLDPLLAEQWAIVARRADP